MFEQPGNELQLLQTVRLAEKWYEHSRQGAVITVYWDCESEKYDYTFSGLVGRYKNVIEVVRIPK